MIGKLIILLICICTTVFYLHTEGFESDPCAGISPDTPMSSIPFKCLHKLITSSTSAKIPDEATTKTLNKTSITAPASPPIAPAALSAAILTPNAPKKKIKQGLPGVKPDTHSQQTMAQQILQHHALQQIQNMPIQVPPAGIVDQGLPGFDSDTEYIFVDEAFQSLF